MLYEDVKFESSFAESETNVEDKKRKIDGHTDIKPKATKQRVKRIPGASRSVAGPPQAKG